MDIGKFQSIGFIGGGNFGKVFRVLDTLLNVERAIKIIQVQNPQEFIDAINEAQILERCRHLHIVDIKEIDVYEDNGKQFPIITMEYLKNGSAQGYLNKNFVTPRKAIQIISESLFGLEHAHNSGIFHRDIKPGNILFADNGQSKLSDFGLAYGLAHQSFSFAGYNAHIAPEVLEGIAQDSISDLYSMGITFHRLINNLKRLDLPFADDTQWLKALKKEKFPERVYEPYIPEQIVKVVKKSIKSDRGNRYENCLQFRQALQRIPLAIEWFPIDDYNWYGILGIEIFELTLYSKRTGYFIDFKRKSKKIRKFCCEHISDEETAFAEFYKIIRQTTIKF